MEKPAAYIIGAAVQILSQFPLFGLDYPILYILTYVLAPISLILLAVIGVKGQKLWFLPLAAQAVDFLFLLIQDGMSFDMDFILTAAFYLVSHALMGYCITHPIITQPQEESTEN